MNKKTLGVIIHPGWAIPEKDLVNEYKDFVKEHSLVLVLPPLMDWDLRVALMKNLVTLNKDYFLNEMDYQRYLELITTAFKKRYPYKKNMKKIKGRKGYKRTRTLDGYNRKLITHLEKKGELKRLVESNYFLTTIFSNNFNYTEYEKVVDNFITDLKRVVPGAIITRKDVCYSVFMSDVIKKYQSMEYYDNVVLTGEYLNQCVSAVQQDYNLKYSTKLKIDTRYGKTYKGDING